MKKAQTLQGKLNFRYAIVIAVVIFSIAILVSIVSARLIREKTIENCRQELSLAVEQMDSILDHIENMSIHFVINQSYAQSYLDEQDASSYEAYQQKANFTQALIEFFGPLHDVASVGFWSDQALAAYVDFTKLGEGHLQEDLTETIRTFEQGSATMQWYLFSDLPYRTDSDGPIRLMLFRKTYALSGEYLGTLVLSLMEESVQGIYAPSSPTASACLIETEDKVQILASSLSEQQNQEVLSLSGQENRKSEAYLTTRCPYPRLNCSFTMVLPKSEIDQDARSLILLILGIGGLGYLVAVALFYRSTKTQLAPLHQIVEKVNEISQGDYTVQIPTEFNSELNDLAIQINRMARNTGILMKEIQKKEARKKAYELSYLQMQMRPHFLYNTLETLCGMVELGEQSQVIVMIQHISGFYREVLNGGKTIINIGSEIKIAEHYLRIMQNRYRESFSFRIEVSEGVWEYAIPKLTLQPILENSIIHGFVVPGITGQILLIGMEQQEEICIRIIDNGAGISSQRLEEITSTREGKKMSFGIASIQERLQLYFGETARVQVESQLGTGTTVSVSFPKKKLLDADYEEESL